MIYVLLLSNTVLVIIIISYFLFKKGNNGLKKYTICINNCIRFDSLSEYIITKKSYISRTIINICRECKILPYNVDFRFSDGIIKDEKIYVYIYCTCEQINLVKYKLLPYQDYFYIDNIYKGFKKQRRKFY